MLCAAAASRTPASSAFTFTRPIASSPRTACPRAAAPRAQRRCGAARAGAAGNAPWRPWGRWFPRVGCDALSATALTGRADLLHARELRARRLLPRLQLRGEPLQPLPRLALRRGLSGRLIPRRAAV